MAVDSVVSVLGLSGSATTAAGLFSSTSSSIGGLLSSASSSASSAQSMFSAGLYNADGMDQLSNTALASGIDKYQQGDYKGAVTAFKQSISLSPNSQYASQAATYMAQAYLKQNDSADAIKAYQQAIKINPQDSDSMACLGQLYFATGDYSDAAKTYKQAIKIDPSGVNHFSLGQAYLNMGRYSDAENEFKTVINLEPDSEDGYYGLGQLYSKEKDYSDAATQYQKAVSVDPNFWEGYFELGCTYADMGNQDKAQEIYDKLEANDPDYANQLNQYMFKVEKPQIAFSLASSTFACYAPFRTKVSVLSSYLANANASTDFTMVFQFNKPMDMSSVENRFNWSIGRASGAGAGGSYNYGLHVPSTEVNVSSIPLRVIYDPQTLQATVTFAVNQNAAADGTIDPSHIVFTFSGTDQNGIAMDPTANQYDGFSGSF